MIIQEPPFGQQYLLLYSTSNHVAKLSIVIYTINKEKQLLIIQVNMV